jgi:hypothetical protein
MLFSIQEIPVILNMGYKHTVSRKSGITVEVCQCVEYLEGRVQKITSGK